MGRGHAACSRPRSAAVGEAGLVPVPLWAPGPTGPDVHWAPGVSRHAGKLKERQAGPCCPTAGTGGGVQ